MLLGTDGGLESIRVVGPQHLTDSSEELPAVAGQSDIVFLIHSLQLCMETADHHVLETVGLDFRPVLYLVRWDVLCIASHIVGSICVSPLCTDGCHQLVVLVGDEVLCCELAYRVNLMVGLLALLRIGHQAVLLVALLDILQERSLCLGIIGPELLGALEHQVLQIVSKSRSLSGVVLRTGTYRDVSLDTWFLSVYGEIHLQAIVEGIDSRLHHVARYGLVLVLLCLGAHTEHQQTEQ